MTQKSKNDRLARLLLKPALWPTALALLVARTLILLPYALLRGLGAIIGYFWFFIPTHRRYVAEINLNIAFPHLSSKERFKLLHAHFCALGIGLFEILLAWWGERLRVQQIPHRVEGLEHLQAGLNAGRGVVLLGAHFTNLDLGGRMFSFYAPVVPMYRPPKNALLRYFLEKERDRHFKQIIERDNLRAVLRVLKNNGIVWYAADQDYGRRYSVFAPFFNYPAATITVPSRLIQAANANVLVASHHYDTNEKRYIFRLAPMPSDYPKDDDLENAVIVNRALENMIRACPEQYLWIHRRFKTRPLGEAPVYTARNSPKRWSKNRYQRFFDESTVLAEDNHGIKVLRHQDGWVLKLFRRKRWVSSALWSPYWQRFTQNALTLHQLGIETIHVSRLVKIPSQARVGVLYRELPGDTLETLFAQSTTSHDLMEKLAAFIAHLHDLGIYFRSLHFGNILVMPSTKWALLDVADLKLLSRRLLCDERVRNFRHLLRYPAAEKAVRAFGISEFADAYFRHTFLGTRHYAPILKALHGMLDEH